MSERGGVFTVSGDDDDVLSLVELVLGALLLEEADHLINTVQSSVEVGPRFPAMACRQRQSWNLRSGPVGGSRRTKHGPTVVVEIHQIPDDIICACTYFRVPDVHYILSFAREGQHVELQLDLIAVQLERR